MMTSTSPSHPNSSKVSSHSCIEKHALELTVCEEAEKVSNDIVYCKEDEGCEGEVLWKTGRLHSVSELSVLDRQAKLVENDEEVDADVDYVNDQAAEVHLSKSTEQYSDVDQLINALHQHNEA